ncbi:MAG: hypothetical protein A2Y33_04505 [Spirochaetes bacterium GWF1_51_8]|nr:MAG: hypothetical protein A2Y33_04505 [Spirochaetes bacterium GWF1_51_8]
METNIPLTQSEKVILELHRKETLNYILLAAGVLAVCAGLGIWWILKFSVEYRVTGIALILLFSAVLVRLILVRSRVGHDLAGGMKETVHSSVTLKTRSGRRHSVSYYIRCGKLKFSVNAEMYARLNQGDPVEIVIAPRSRILFDIRKIAHNPPE